MNPIVLSLLLISCQVTPGPAVSPKEMPEIKPERKIPALFFKPGEKLKSVIPFQKTIFALTWSLNTDGNVLYRLYNDQGEVIFVFVEINKEESNLEKLNKK